MDTSPDGASLHDQFEDEDEFQLVEWMTLCRDDDPAIARAAWATLYNRHVRYLLKVVRQPAIDAFGHAGAVEDVVGETFKKLCEKAETFEGPTERLDREGKRRWFLAWLGTIARNVIRDAQRASRHVPTQNIDQDHWADIAADDRDTDPSWVRQVMLKVLDEREQDILRTTYRYYDPTTGKSPRLPSDEVERLCSMYGITPENLRQIRLRAFNKLKEALESAQIAG